ncbi:S1C family serine protease [Brevibacterium yomogidense]|uniref:S1C family serine protease n=1 Tax=Brevibacterium yomogidense TaxID=946573 RepID=UPI0018E03A81
MAEVPQSAPQQRPGDPHGGGHAAAESESHPAAQHAQAEGGPATGPMPSPTTAHHPGGGQHGGGQFGTGHPGGGQPGGGQPGGGAQSAGYPAAGAAAHPAQKIRRRGPGWAALIIAALLAAIVGATVGGGSAWLLSSDVSPVASQPSEDAPQQSDRSISKSTETPDWAQIADQTTPGVAAIQVAVGGEVSGLGSGFVYDDQGHVVTNNHVVAPADTDDGEVQVVLADGSMIGATLVGRNPETDVAVLKLDSLPEDLTPLPIGASADLFVGDPVMALGNPLGLADTVTTGIVSALDRPVSTENIGDVSEQEVAMTITNAIQTDAAINPGNSGGPLVNGNGEVVGINSSAATLSDPTSSEAQSGSIGIGFAITVEQATTIADQLIETGEAKHPLLGVTMVNSTVDAQGVTRGSARVTAVEDGTPAAAAGFQEDDEIIAIDDKPVNSGVSLQAFVRSSVSGDPVEFTVVRGGREETLTATLEMR